MGNGHPDASRYRIGMIWDEAELVRQRLNAAEATRAVLLQMAISSLPNMAVAESSTKAAAKQFRERLTELTED